MRNTGLMPAPSLEPTLERDDIHPLPATMSRRDALIAGIAVILAVAAVGVAEVLVRAIALVTNLAFYQTVSTTYHGPAGNTLGVLVLVVPIVGALIVGAMARFGSRAIRGHGIPEAMEQILTNESRIPLRITFLKPASAAIAIGTGGPFGAEGPIIATGGALGSAIGQFIAVTAIERKTLLAAGAAAGMTAIFGTPIAGILLAVELLLFEYRARSVVPVALATATAVALRSLLHGGEAVFACPDLGSPTALTSVLAVLAGGVVGIASTYITRGVYWIEDQFEHLPVHWMWWPAIGAVAVGAIGYFAPRTLGVGYDNIENALAGSFTVKALAVLFFAKLVSWAIALGSGTSGGTLAPLLTLGAALGYLLLSPFDVDPRVGALVGMTAMFAGASRALLTSIAFAIEATHQIDCAGPIVAGVALAYFFSCVLMKTTIMTEKLARRGVHVGSEYGLDPLAHRHARDVAQPLPDSIADLPTVHAGDSLRQVAERFASTKAALVVVLDRDEPVGVISPNDLMHAFATTDHVRQPGRRLPLGFVSAMRRRQR